MVDLSKDPIINVIHNGIKNDIRVLLKNDCLSGAAILIYSGIDTMAYLNMPESQDSVTGHDFIKWADYYINFPCEEQLTGIDLYGARCGMLHNYSVYSKLSRQNKCRLISYADKIVPEVVYQPQINKDLVIVSIKALADAFFRGMDEFLIYLFANKAKARVAEKRFKTIVQIRPADELKGYD